MSAPPAPTPKRPPPLSLQSMLLAAAALLLLGLGAATQWTLQKAQQREVEHALDGAERSARKLAVRVSEVLDRIDQTTRVVKVLRENGSRMTLPQMNHAGLLAADVSRAVFVTDRRGMLLASSDAAAVPLNIADEDEFKRHARAGDLGLTIGPPGPDHLGGGWAIPAMRRLAGGAPGGFDGVTVALLDPAALTRGFGVGEAPGTSFGVLGLDNIYRSRLLDGRTSFGERVDAQQLLARAAAMRTTLQPGISPIDGKARYVGVVPVERYPLLALVAVAADDVDAAYAQARERVLQWAGATAALLLVGTALLWRQAHRLGAAHRAERHARALYAATLDGSLDALWLLRAERGADGEVRDFIVADANRRAAGVLGLALEDLRGRRATDLVPSMREDGLLEQLRRVMQRQQPVDFEAAGVTPEVRDRWLHYQLVPVEDGVALILRDITERRDAQRQLAQMARHDMLTGLANRRHFEEQLAAAAARAGRSGAPLALLYLDLDGFKRVNDNLGHEAGDQLLVAVAQRLKAGVRASDTVSRLGGDEFTVILEDAGSDADRLQQCERLLDALSRPHRLGGREVLATPSIGIAVYRPGESLEALRQRADAAMYEAKRAGKACVRIAAGLAPA